MIFDVTQKETLAATVTANGNRPLPRLRKSRPFRRSGVEWVFAKSQHAAGPCRRARRIKRSHIAVIIILLFRPIVNTPPKIAPSKKAHVQARNGIRRARGSTPLSSKIRFASLSMSLRDEGLAPTSRRSTKYASSKYRLSPVRTMIMRFCAPFSIRSPHFYTRFLQ